MEHAKRELQRIKSKSNELPTFKITLAYDGTVCRLAAAGRRRFRPGAARGRAARARRSRRHGARRRADRCGRSRARPGRRFTLRRDITAAVVRARSTRTCPTPCASSRRKKRRRRSTRGSERSRRPTATGSGTAMSSARSSSRTRGTSGRAGLDAMQARRGCARRAPRFRRVSGRRQHARTTEREVFASRMIAEPEDPAAPHDRPGG